MNDTLEFSDFGLYINSYHNDCLIESWQKIDNFGASF